MSEAPTAPVRQPTPGAAAILIAAVVLFHLGGAAGNAAMAKNTGSPATGVAGLNPGLMGKFWYRPDASETYYQVQAATGAVSKFITQGKFLVPSPDGTKYILHSRVTDPRTDAEALSIEVFNSATRTRISRFTLDGYAVNFRFSRDSRYLGMVRTTGLLAKKEGLTVVDLGDPANPATLVAFTGSPTLFVADFDWLPNNQYMYLRSDNKLFVGTPRASGKDDQPRGTIAPPANRQTVYSLDISPDGTQLLLQFKWKEGPSTKVDVWLADATGANLERVTTSTMTVSSHWSPDGQYIAMKSDAGGSCVGGACDTYCRRWYVPRTARDVNERAGGIELRSFANAVRSRPVMHPCTADFAWTR